MQTENWQTLVKEQQFNDVLMEWNAKINLVSRKKLNVLDLIEDSKLFFKGINFAPGIRLLDLGTGGGFPGIVIAINYPEIKLVLVDSIQKKIGVVKDVIKRLELRNCTAICSRAEELANDPNHAGKYDYVTARSVTVLQDLCMYAKPLLKQGGKLVTVKGGDISGEIHKTRKLNYVKNVEKMKFGERILVIVEFSS